jgi:hypothetical protein
VLRDAGGVELARHAFTPGEMTSGPPLDPNEPEIHLLVIAERVPWVEGTQRVDITGPTGTLATIAPGPATPVVEVTAPTGGETFDGDSITVTWNAADPDGDPLTFNIVYVGSAGSVLVAQGLRGTSIAIDTDNLVGGNGYFEVYASDGLNTSSATSGAFVIPDHLPNVEIISPLDDTIISNRQTLALEARFQDVESGSGDAALLMWESDLDGWLGSGPSLSVTGLRPGLHTITFTGYDSAGNIVTDSVRVTVIAGMADLPAPADTLDAEPAHIIFSTIGETIITEQMVTIVNRTSDRVILWEATTSAPWLRLGATSGATPGELTVSLDLTALPPDAREGTVTLTSPGLPEQRVEIQVEVRQAAQEQQLLYLPLILRDGATQVNAARPGASD